MQLRILFSVHAQLRDRCQVAGVRAIHGNDDYEDGAVVPAGEWQPITSELADRLLPDSTTDESTLVELVKLLDHERYAADNAASAATLADLSWCGARADYLGRVVSPPQALTTTVNPAGGRRIGIHLDNWDRLPNSARHRSRRRLCFNLGPGTRYLLVADLDVREISRTLHPRDHEQRYPHTDDIRRYVAHGGPLRCFRLRFEPGDGYVAPTELLPHDGSTQDEQEQSTAAFWLGRWPAAELPYGETRMGS